MIVVYAAFTKKKVFLYLLFLMTSLLLSSCAILSKNRVKKNRGIQKSDDNLPIIAYPSKLGNESKTLMVFLSGDGGWIDFADELAVNFAEKGLNTIGFNSRSYFWDQRTPAETAKDFTIMLQNYMKEYKCKSAILCGYSFGADVVPFIFSNLPQKEKVKIKSLILLSPFASTDFIVHTSDLFNLGGDDRKFKVKKEVERLKIPVFCYYGEDENPKALSGVKGNKFYLNMLKGGHRYDESAIMVIINNLLKYETFNNLKVQN